MVAVLFCAKAVAAAQISISSYDITEAIVSGWGLWAHTYNGTITPTGQVVPGGDGLLADVANYTGGGGTLNDGVIGDTSSSQLFVSGAAPDGGPILNPVITLHLPGLFQIHSINIFGGDGSTNYAPGCLTGVTVGIGGSIETINTTPWGKRGLCAPVNDLASLTGTALAGLATDTITLSGFSGPLPFGEFSITEIRVDGTAADVPVVPEPALLLLLGMGAIGCARRRANRRS